MFDSIINNPVKISKPNLIPVSNHSLDAVIQLIDNCKDLSVGIQYATFDKVGAVIMVK